MAKKRFKMAAVAPANWTGEDTVIWITLKGESREYLCQLVKAGCEESSAAHWMEPESLHSRYKLTSGRVI